MNSDARQQARSHYLAEARHFLRTHRYDQAIETASKCIAEQPESLEGHMVLMSAFVEAKRWREAEEEAPQVLRLGPTHADAFYLVAQFHKGCNRPQVAVKLLLDSLKFAPHNANTWALLAESQQALGRRPAAVVAAQEAARWAPHHPDYLAMLAVLEAPPVPTRTQARVLAGRLLKVLELDPENRYTWATLANLYAYALGDWPAVVEATTRALARDPHDPVKQKLLHDASMRQYWAYRLWSAPFRMLKAYGRNLRSWRKRQWGARDVLRIFSLLYFGIFYLSIAVCLILTYLTWWWPVDWICQKIIRKGAVPMTIYAARPNRWALWRSKNLFFTLVWWSPPILVGPLCFIPALRDNGLIVMLEIVWLASYFVLSILAMTKLGDTYLKDWQQRRKDRRDARKQAKKNRTLPPRLKS